MRGSPVQFSDFGGGINAQSNVYSLQPNECRDAFNVVSVARGGFRKRNGNALFGSSGDGALVTLMEAPDVGALAVTTTSGRFARVDASTGIFTTIAGTAATPGVPWEVVRAPVSGAQGPFFAVNGVDTPQFVDAALATRGDWTATAGTVPNGRFIKFFGNKVFVARTAAKPSRLQWSGLSDTGPNTRDWPASNYVDFDPDDGEEITGLGTVGPYLLVFKPSKTWVVLDLDTGANRPLGTNVGCVAHRSIVETPGGTFFLSEDQGVMRTDGSTAVRVSDKIKPLLDKITPSAVARCAGAYFDRHYYLAAPAGGSLENSVVFDFDDLTDAWWRHTHSVSHWAKLSGVLYAARDTGPEIDRCYVVGRTQDTTAGVASSFTAYWKGPTLSFGSTYLRKRVRRIHFDGAGSADILLSRDFSTGYSLLGSVAFPAGGGGSFGVSDGSSFGASDGSTFGSFNEIGEAALYTPGVGRVFSLEFLNTSASRMEVDSYTFSITGRRD